VTDPRQIDEYDHLVGNPGAALFLGMSLSKTVTALSYLYDMHYAEAAILKTLVVAPDKVARITWPDELQTWAHLDGMRYSLIAGDEKKREKALATDAEVYIIGVDNLAWLIDKYIYQRVSKVSGEPYGPWLGRLPFDAIVIDELSLFKGRDSGRFKKLRRALDLSEVAYRVGMTGTPTPNGYIDLWAQMVLLDEGARLGDTFGKYLDKFFTTRGNGMIVYEYIPRPGAVKVIARKIQDIALTMLTRDKVKLPALHTVDHEITLAPFDKETYDDLEREYALDFLGTEDEVTVKTAADLTNKLLQVSSGAIYADRDPDNPKAPRVWHEVNTAKLEALGELLTEHHTENFICVYQFRHEIDRIKARFPFARELRKGKATVQDFREWNEGKIRLLLIHPNGAGHGLNLQFGGRRMVWFSVTWNLAHYLQTVARLLRRGALREIYIHRLIAKGTRDVRVRARLGSKDSNQTFLLNEIKDLRKKYGTKRK
jgi:SNF2 family DNA or RNA helicase